ncbi:hypothetical protein V6C27_00095 [Peptococcaceae bacterium 1198_IL3148]
MSENRRFNWDVLLEQEPDKPPLRTEPSTPRVEVPLEFDSVPGDMDVPDDMTEQQTVAMPKNKEPKKSVIKIETEKLTEIKRQLGMPEPKAEAINVSQQKQPGLDLLTGNITPNQIVNAFILSEVFGKPKGLRRRRYR